MRNYISILAGMLALLSTPVFSQSVETRSKSAPDQKPAFSNQTRVQAVKTQANIKVSIITEKLSRPWGFDFLLDGRMIVSELQGAIRIVSKNGTIGESLKGVPPVRVFGAYRAVLHPGHIVLLIIQRNSGIRQFAERCYR